MEKNINLFSLDIDIAGIRASAAAGAREIEKLTKKKKELKASTEDETEALVELEAELKEARSEYRQNIKTLSKLKDAEGDVTLNIEQTRAALSRVSKDWARATKVEGENSKISQALSKQKLELTNKLKDLEGQTGDNRRNVGNYSDALTGLFPIYDNIQNSIGQVIEKLSAQQTLEANFAKSEKGYKSLGATIKSGFTQARIAIAQATRASLSFIATPIGAAITALTSFVLVAKAVLDYNDSISEAKRLTENITGTSQELGTELRSQAIAIEEVFGTSIEESLETAKTLVNEFGIGYTDALDLIQNGLVEGGQTNDEYLTSLKEFSVFFSQAGFTAEEFKDIINTGYDLGLYQDKLPDAIKEFSLAITEETKTTTDALKNAFGAEFTSEITAQVRTGEITVKGALERIATEAERVGLNSQEAAQLTADLFKGAGEDAGGALVIFEAVNKALRDEGKELTALQAAQLESVKSLDALEKAKANAFESDEVIAFKQEFTNAWRAIKTFFFNAIAEIRKRYTSLIEFQVKAVFGFVNAFKQAPVAARAAFGQIANGLRTIASSLFEIGNIAKDVFDFDLDFKDARAAFGRLKDGVGGGLGDLRNSIKGLGVDLKNSFTEGFDAAKVAIDKRKEQVIAQAKFEKEQREKAQLDTDTNVSGGGGKSKEVDQAKIDAERLAEIERQKTEKIKALRQELDLFIAQSNREKVNAEKITSQELLDAEIARIESVKEKRAAFAIEQNALGKLSDTQLKTELLNLETAFLTQRKALNDQFDAEQNAKKLEDAQAQKELDAINHANDIELLRLRNSDRLAVELELLTQREAQEIASAEKIGADITKIENKFSLLRTNIEKRTQKNKLSLFGSVAAQVGDLFGEQTVAAKAAGIAEATINTYLGATKALGSFPPPFSFIAAAATIASGLISVGKIAGVKLERGGKAGTTGGRRHYAGGTKYYGEDGQVVELERGEDWFVLNRRASAAISALSAHNVAHGGADFAGGTTFARDGGRISRDIQRQSDPKTLAKLLGNEIAGMTIITDVKDINSAQAERAEIVDFSEF